jgi:hypothetical protein
MSFFSGGTAAAVAGATAAAGGGGGGGVAASLASKSGLFRPTAILEAARDAVAGKARKEAAAVAASVIGGHGGKIEWGTYNWPSSRIEFFSIIHFDLGELKEKRDERIYSLVLWSYRWFLATLALCTLNFVNTIVLSSIVRSPAYAGYYVLISLIWLMVWFVGGMAAVYKGYHGYAEGSGKSKVVARAVGLCLMVLALVHVFGHFANINGIAGE